MSADADRFEALARDLGPNVLTYLARRVHPREEAADVYQHVLETTWRRLAAVPPDDGEALAWMIGVARRCWANQRRATVRRSAATARLAEYLRTAVAAPEVDLTDALSRLADDDRELVTLVYWDGLTQTQAAAVLQISPAAARKRMERARSSLRDCLANM